MGGCGLVFRVLCPLRRAFRGCDLGTKGDGQPGPQEGCLIVKVMVIPRIIFVTG